MPEEFEKLIEERERLKSLIAAERGNVLYEEFALIPEEAITESLKLKAEIERLKELVYKDELTGVLNRRGLVERFEPLFNEALHQKKKPEHTRKFEVGEFSVIFIDADNFKSINDSFGHDEGDAVLRNIARTLMESVRQVDCVARLGGEEFVAVLLGAGENDAYQKAEEIRKKLPNVVKANGESGVTASVGVASLGKSDADNFDELIAYADKAMYEAKVNRGKNNTVKFSDIGK